MGKVTSIHKRRINYKWKVKNCNNGDCKDYKKPPDDEKEFVIFPPRFFEGKEHESHESRA